MIGYSPPVFTSAERKSIRQREGESWRGLGRGAREMEMEGDERERKLREEGEKRNKKKLGEEGEQRNRERN